MIRSVIHFAVLGWLVLGCAPQPSERSRVVLDVDSLLNKQSLSLAQHEVSLHKSASVGGVASDSTWVPSENQWKTELRSFGDLAIINKTLYKDVYQAEGPLEDRRSNLHIQRYATTQAPLALLDIYYMDEVSRFRRLEGIFHSVNRLYAAHRTLTLEFDEVQGKPMLTHYRISGYQKLALRDTVQFTIEGVINW